MSFLLNIKALRDGFSANEKRIADFILENSQYMRDYSSQQLASAVRVSQSSIVKFSQKLGCKGYPDLKMAINESVITARLADSDKTNIAPVAHHEYIPQVQQAANDAFTQWTSLNKNSSFEDSANSLINAEKTVLLSFSLGLNECRDLSAKLFGQGKACHVIRTDSNNDINTLASLTANDALVIVEENDFPVILQSTVQKLHQQGVAIILMSKFGQSRLASIGKHHLFWLANAEPEALNRLQADITISALFSALTLAFDNINKNTRLN